MAEQDASLDPDVAQQVLRDFVDQAKQSQELQTHQELQRIVRPEVTSALSTLILSAGRPSRNPNSLAILESKRKFRKVQGVVKKAHDNSDNPGTIYLAEYRRGLFSFRRRSWATIPVTGNLEYGTAADDGREFYLVDETSDGFASFFRDKVGTDQVYGVNSSETGLEIAGRAIRKRPEILNGFLKVAANLTRELVEVQK